MKPPQKNNVSGERLTITRRRNTRTKTSDNGSESSPLPIPIELIIEIFSRLPLKSIAICRCVSKLWYSVLLSQDFTDLFSTKSFARPPQLLYVRPKDGELFFFSSPQPQNPEENSSVSADRLMHFSDFNFDTSCEISGLVHGLVCRVHTVPGTTDNVPVLCNPSTGQALVLPKVKTRRSKVKCLLGYDPVGKQFKVLSMTQPYNGREWRQDIVSEEHQVLTLGTGELSWRMIQCWIPHFYPREAICINGVLYYTPHYKSIMIVCFHVRSEKFRLIFKVKGSLERVLPFGNMVNWNGKLGLIMSEDNEGKASTMVDGRSSRFKLWVLEDVENQEWSERVYALPASWKNVAGEHTFSFVGVAARTNEIVLSSSLYTVNPSYLIYFSPEKNTVVRVEIQGVDMGVPECTVLQTFLDHVEDVKLYPKCTLDGPLDDNLKT